MNRVYSSIRFVSFIILTSLLIAIAPLDARAASTDTGLIWKVTSGNATAYVVGSVHNCKKELYPLPSIIIRAFEFSEVIAVEANILDVDLDALSKAAREDGTLPDNVTLDQVLSERTLVMANLRGLNLKTYRRYRPWLLAITLSANVAEVCGYHAALGMDLQLLKMAKKREMPVQELEGVESQFEIIGSMSPTTEDAFLFMTLNSIPTMEKVLEEIFVYWRKGDAWGMEVIMGPHFWYSPFFFNIRKYLLLDRNVVMVDSIEGYLADGRTHFVVMGSMHTVGRGSVIDLLRERGYQVRQLGVNGGI